MPCRATGTLLCLTLWSISFYAAHTWHLLGLKLYPVWRLLSLLTPHQARQLRLAFYLHVYAVTCGASSCY
jgi:hypothetical protein